jgi:hypothetical protein
MARQYSSNKPFKNRPNVRPGAGTIRYSWNPTPRQAPNIGTNSTRNSTYEPCSGPYDNIVSYVWEIDTSNGQHTAYVDCDYVE